MPNTIAWWFVNVSDREIIKIWLGPDYNGIYAIAHKVPALCTVIFSVFQMAWVENAVDSINDLDKDIYYNSILKKIIPLALCAGACVIAVNRYFYKWIWDVKYLTGQYHVFILMFAVIFSFLAQFLGGILTAQKRTKANGATTIIAAAINVVFNLIFIRSIGLYAASISTLISYLFMFCSRLFLLRKEIKIKFRLQYVFSFALFAFNCIIQFLTNEVVGVLCLALTAVFSVVINFSAIKDVLNMVFKKNKTT